VALPPVRWQCWITCTVSVAFFCLVVVQTPAVSTVQLQFRAFSHNFLLYILQHCVGWLPAGSFVMFLFDCIFSRLFCLFYTLSLLLCILSKFFKRLWMNEWMILTWRNHSNAERWWHFLVNTQQRLTAATKLLQVVTLCPTPCQIFVSRCFSSSTLWTWWVSQMFLCMHPCQRRIF